MPYRPNPKPEPIGRDVTLAPRDDHPARQTYRVTPAGDVFVHCHFMNYGQSTRHAIGESWTQFRRINPESKLAHKVRQAMRRRPVPIVG